MKFTAQTIAALALTLCPLVLADGDNCIHLKGDKSYTWKADGSFTGEGQIDDATHCFGPGSGGISLGVPGAPKGAAGNTRFECHFPENPTDADFYNCNLSLVDGFSAAVTCETAGGGWPNSKNDSAPLGCGYDLMKGCPESMKDPGCQCCKNAKGAHVSDLGGVDSAFHACQVSDEWPNTAELYFSMVGAYMFKKTDFPITCQVGKGEEPPAAAAGKVKREVVHEHMGGHVKRSPMHAKHVHARGLMDVMS